jgi:hypothetical protein
MNSTLLVKRAVGITAIVSGILSFTSLILFVIGINYNLDIFSFPVLLLSTEGINPVVLKWSMIADLFGYYLLLLPVIFYLYEWMNMKSPWRLLYTFSGTSYVLIGAMGASILAFALPPIFFEFQKAGSLQQENLKMNFQLLTNIIYGGMWNTLEVIFGGIWWLGIGSILHRWKKVFGYTTMALGAFTLLDALGTISGIKLFSLIGLNVYLILAPIWITWLGIILIHK